MFNHSAANYLFEHVNAFLIDATDITETCNTVRLYNMNTIKIWIFRTFLSLVKKPNVTQS